MSVSDAVFFGCSTAVISVYIVTCTVVMVTVLLYIFIFLRILNGADVVE